MHSLDIRPDRFKQLTDFLDLELLSEDVFLAGGALRSLIDGKKPKDYDLFFTGPDAIPVTRERLEKHGFELIFECPKGELWTYVNGDMKIQLVANIFGTPEEIIDHFDFGATLAALDIYTFYYHKAFVRDVKTRKVSLHRLTYPVATLKRLAKYHGYGFNVNKCLKDIVISISQRGREFNEDDDELRFYID